MIGKPVSRIDGPLKVTGEARFAAEFRAGGHGLRRARLQHDRQGPHRRGSTRASAEAAPGVVAGDDASERAADEAAAGVHVGRQGGGRRRSAGHAGRRIHWNGQPIAVVLAETQEQADHATSLIRATYEAEEAVTSFAEAKAKGTTPGAFMGEPLHDESGDAEAALAAAPRPASTRPTARRVTTTTRSSCTRVDGRVGGRRRCASTTPRSSWRTPPGRSRRCSASRRSRSIVTSPFVGGGFGGKWLWQHQVLAAAASKLAGRPVRIVAVARGRLPRRRRAQPHRAAGRARRGRRRQLAALIHTGIDGEDRGTT